MVVVPVDVVVVAAAAVVVGMMVWAMPTTNLVCDLIVTRPITKPINHPVTNWPKILHGSKFFVVNDSVTRPWLIPTWAHQYHCWLMITTGNDHHSSTIIPQLNDNLYYGHYW